jgi:hypothetical protein
VNETGNKIVDLFAAELAGSAMSRGTFIRNGFIIIAGSIFGLEALGGIESAKNVDFDINSANSETRYLHTLLTTGAVEGTGNVLRDSAKITIHFHNSESLIINPNKNGYNLVSDDTHTDRNLSQEHMYWITNEVIERQRNFGNLVHYMTFSVPEHIFEETNSNIRELTRATGSEPFTVEDLIYHLHNASDFSGTSGPSINYQPQRFMRGSGVVEEIDVTFNLHDQ